MKLLDNQITLILIGFFSILAFWSALLNHSGISAFFAFLVLIQVISQVAYKFLMMDNNSLG